MIDQILKLIIDTILSAISMLNSASVWIIFSFAVAGVIHEFVNAKKLQKASVGTTKISGLISATISGFLLPICSCGTIPLGVSLYYSGAYLGPVLAFMTATPMINPIALILCFGLLGPQIGIIYFVTGLVAPMIIGMIGNKLGGKELFYAPAYENQQKINLNFEEEKLPFSKRLKSGLNWAFADLAVVISKYTVSGMLIAGLLFAVIPQSAIQTYLGNPGVVSLFGITVVAALMYVCAVGHIPFIAAVVASGAAPGVAITFLMAGCATNIAELITIGKTIGKRTVTIYAVTVTLLSLVAGLYANYSLPNFQPVLDYDAINHSISSANTFILAFPDWLQGICTAILIGYACFALVRYIRKKVKEANKGSAEATNAE